MIDYKKLFKESLTPNFLNEEDRATRVDKMLSGEYEDEDYKDSKRYADVRADLDEEIDDEDIVIYDGEEHIIMSRDGNMIYIRPLEDSAILGKKDVIKVPARALAYKSDLDKMYDEYKPKDEVNEVDEKWDKIARDEYGKPWMELSIAQKQEMLSYANRETEKQFQTDYERRRRGDYSDDMEDGMTDYQRRRMDEDMGEWPKELTSRYSDEYRFELEKVMSDRAKYRVIDIESGELKGTPVFGTPESLMAYADDLIKPQGGTQSTNLGESLEEDMNDPVLMKTRAAQMKRDAMDKKDLENKSKRISAEKAIDLRYELSILNKEREDILMRIEDIGVEMDQTAEPEGGPIADKLGERLMAAQKDLRDIDSKIIDIKDDLGVFDMNESVNENTLGDLVKKYGKDLINFVIGIDELTKDEIKDVEYLDDRIQIHLEEPEIRQKYLPEGTCGYGEDGVIGDKPAGPDLNEDEIPSYLTKNIIFGKAVEDSVSFNDFQKRVYGILGPKYYKLTDQGALKDFYDSVRVTKPNLEEDDELNVNVDNANDNYAKSIDAESRSGAYESLQESLRKKLRERLK